MKKVALSLVIVLLICNVFAQEVTKTVEFKTGRASGSAAESKVLKNPKKIYIMSFDVNYQLVYVDAEQTREGVYHGSTSANVTVGADGVKLEDLQKITDDAYTKFVDMLKVGGYQIVSADEASKLKAYAGYERIKGPQMSRAQKIGFATVTPTGYEYFRKGTNQSGKEKADVFVSAKVVAQFKDVIVVSVNIDVPFMTDSEATGSKLATSAVGGVSKVVASPELKIASESSKVSYNIASGAIILPLKEDIFIKGVFEDKKYKASAAAQQNQAYNMGHWSLVVSEHKGATNVQSAPCDPQIYAKGVKEAVNLFISEAVNKFLNYD